MAAPTIDNVTISSVDDHRIVLANSTIARKISIGTDWLRLRIVLRHAVDDTGANLTSTPRFWVGMMSNPTPDVSNGPLGATTSHFVGGVTGIATWSRQTSPTRYYLNSAAGFTLGKRVGNTSTLTNGGNFFHFYAQPSTLRTVFMVEIVKSSPNYTISYVEHWFNGTSSVADVPLANVLGCCQTLTTSQAISTWLPSGTYGAYGGTSVTVAVNESVDGPLNAVCCAWDRTTPAMRISDLYWARIA